MRGIIKAGIPSIRLNRKRVQRILSVLIVCYGLFPFHSGNEASGKNISFSPGEKMTFKVRWEFVLAGEAVLEVLPVELIKGVRSFHFVFTARTNDFVDHFYKVRDEIDSYTDTSMTHALLYRKKHRAKSKEEVVVDFDWEGRVARYSSFGETMEPVPLQPGTFDPLSIFFAFRCYDLHMNREIKIPVTDGKKCVMGVVRVIRREEILLGEQSYDTFLVEPDLEHIGGVFMKSRNAKLQIWITADTRRIPVRIKSRVKVGSFLAELVSYEGGSE